MTKSQKCRELTNKALEEKRKNSQSKMTEDILRYFDRLEEISVSGENIAVFYIEDELIREEFAKILAKEGFTVKKYKSMGGDVSIDVSW